MLVLLLLNFFLIINIIISNGLRRFLKSLFETLRWTQRREGSLGDGPETQHGVNSGSHHIWDVDIPGWNIPKVGWNPWKYFRALGSALSCPCSALCSWVSRKKIKSPNFSRGKLDAESNSGKFWIYNWLAFNCLIPQDFNPLKFHGKMSWFNLCGGKTRLALSQPKIPL